MNTIHKQRVRVNSYKAATEAAGFYCVSSVFRKPFVFSQKIQYISNQEVILHELIISQEDKI